MRIIELELENFMQFEKAKFEFPSGLVFILGKNGSGKTTILDAILFAMYRKTIRMSKIQDLIRKGADETKVKLVFEWNGSTYTVERYIKSKMIDVIYKDGSIIAEGNTNVSKYIVDNILKHKYETFVKTVFVGQRDITRIIDYKELYSTIDELFSVNVLNIIYTALRELIKEKESDLKMINRTIETTKEYIEDLKNMNVNVDIYKNKLDSIKNDINKIKDKIKSINVSENIDKEIDKLTKSISVIALKLEALNKYSKYKNIVNKYDINEIRPILVYVNKCLSIFNIDRDADILDTIKYSLNRRDRIFNIKSYINNLDDMYMTYNKLKTDIEQIKPLIDILDEIESIKQESGFDIDTQSFVNIIKDIINEKTLDYDKFLKISSKVSGLISINLNNGLCITCGKSDVLSKPDINKHELKYYISNLGKVVFGNSIIDRDFINTIKNKFDKKQIDLINKLDDVNNLKLRYEELLNKLRLLEENNMLKYYDILNIKMNDILKRIDNAPDLDIDMVDNLRKNYKDYIKLVDIARNIKDSFESLTDFKNSIENINILKNMLKQYKNELNRLKAKYDEYNELKHQLDKLMNEKNILENVIKDNMNKEITIKKYKDKIIELEDEKKIIINEIEEINLYANAVNRFSVELNNKIYGTLKSIVLHYLDMFNFEFDDIIFDQKGIYLRQNGNYIESKFLSNAQQVCLGLSLRLALTTISESKFGFELFILDEPTEGFDYTRVETLKQILIKLSESKQYQQIFVVTHNKELIDGVNNCYYFEIDKESHQ